MKKEDYYDIIDGISDSFYQLNAGGYFTLVNKVLTDRFGITREVFYTKHFLDIVNPRYHEIAKINFQRVMRGEDRISHELAYEGANGQVMYVEVHTSPIREGKRVVGLRGTSRDITDRKQAEEALRESELRFRLAAESCADLIWEWDIVTGELTWFGPIDKLLGYGVGEFPRTIDAWESIIHRDDHDRIMAKLNQHLEDGTPYSEEYRVLRKDGSILYWTDRGTAVRYPETKPAKMIGAVTDITELKLAEEKVKAGEKQFRDLMELIPIGILTIEGTRFGYVNAAFEKITGYSRDELRQTDVWDMIHPEFKDDVRQYLQKQHKRVPVPEIFGLKIITKSGKERWVQRRAIPITVREKSLVLLTVEDITDRKESEEKLKVSEERFRGLVESIPVGLMTIEGTKYGYVNPAIEKISGYTRDELYLMDLWDLVHPEFKDTLKEYVAKQNRGESVPKLYAVKIVTKGGEERWVERRAIPIELGEKPLVLITATDITESKSAEEILRTSEEKYRSLLENASDAIVLTDEPGNIVEVNRKAEELLGHSREELLQMHYSQLHPKVSLERTIEAFKNIVKNGHGILRDSSICRKDGKVIPVDITGSVVEYSGMKVIQGLFRDITEHKHIEDTLEGLVSKRTAELSEKNEQLMIEIKERERVEASLRKRGDELKLRAGELKELNSALKVLLKQRDEDKRELEDKVMANVSQLVLPYLAELKKGRLDARSKVQASILEANLNNITSSFTHRLSSKYSGFTPREIQVANLIRQGKSTKEMAEYLRVSPSAINLYRLKVRKKLGITSRKINLRSHLMSLS